MPVIFGQGIRSRAGSLHVNIVRDMTVAALSEALPARDGVPNRL